jgi:ABC-2 type transport system ATP-binding protein
MHSIRARALVKTYSGGRGKEPVRALDGLDLDVPSGTVFGLLGPNGAGKSTTVKILTTLAAADSGSAEVAEIDVAADPQAVRRSIGLVSQQPSTIPIDTGRENLVLAARLQGLDARTAGRRANELLERFGLKDAADRRASTYSGGMARKLDVAMGLVHTPTVLFLDEPTTGLDPEARADMWAEIARLAEVDGLTVLLTTHYLDEVDQLADQLAIVDSGRVVVTGTPAELKGALRGETVTVDFADETTAKRAGTVLGSVLREPSRVGASVHGRSADGAAAVPALIGALEHAGVAAAGVRVAQPSLDDVYLHYVGHRYAAEEAAA